LEHIFRHAIIASPAPYAYISSEEYRADIIKLTSGQTWQTEPAQIPVNGDDPPKPNFKLISFDARCCVTRNALYEVMSHIAAAVWGGKRASDYFSKNFSTATLVIEACMRQGDNPNGGVWTLDNYTWVPSNRDQTKRFTPAIIGRYVRMRPGAGMFFTLNYRQIVIKDPTGNVIPVARSYGTGAEFTLTSGFAAKYGLFIEFDLGGNKNIGSIEYFGPGTGFENVIGGTQISVWPSKIGWDIPVRAFTTIDQDKYTIDRMVHAKVMDGTVRNYSQCVSNADIHDWAKAAALPGDDGNANDTLRRICAPYFNTSVWTPGDSSEDRKGDYKINIGATTRGL
jgi:hypothetical protein